MTHVQSPPTAEAVVAALHDTRALAIFRYRGGGDTLAAIQAARAGGIVLCEVTADTPGALDAIHAAADAGPVGMGTVTTAAQVADCAAAGGSFVVSPAVCDEVIAAAHRHGLLALPGVLTPSEVQAATRLGAQVMKLFPVGPLGAGYLAALRGPYPDIPFVATGGITTANAGSFLAAGATAVAVGSSVAGSEAPSSQGDASQITVRAAALLERIAPLNQAAVPARPGTSLSQEASQ